MVLTAPVRLYVPAGHAAGLAGSRQWKPAEQSTHAADPDTLVEPATYHTLT